MSSGGCSQCLEILCAVILPPLGVFFRYGCCSLEFLISVLLTILGYIPGIIYAVWVIVKTPPEQRSIDEASPYEPLA